MTAKEAIEILKNTAFLGTNETREKVEAAVKCLDDVLFSDAKETQLKALNEAIKFCQKKADQEEREAEQAAIEQYAYCHHQEAKNYYQLAEWLKELKEWRNGEKTVN